MVARNFLGSKSSFFFVDVVAAINRFSQTESYTLELSKKGLPQDCALLLTFGFTAGTECGVSRTV